MEGHLKWNNFTSYSNEGDTFIQGMMSINERWEHSRKLFNSFIEPNGFTGWHIHDGWVRHDHNSGADVLSHETINITWITEHAGYSHTNRCPDIGEKMLVLKDSPDIDRTKPFEMYCYQVIGEPRSYFFKDIELKLIEVKQAIFNKETGQFEFYTPPARRNIFSFFSNKTRRK